MRSAGEFSCLPEDGSFSNRWGLLCNIGEPSRKPGGPFEYFSFLLFYVYEIYIYKEFKIKYLYFGVTFHFENNVSFSRKIKFN